jgi:hypothetical protein
LKPLRLRDLIDFFFSVSLQHTQSLTKFFVLIHTATHLYFK